MVRNIDFRKLGYIGDYLPCKCGIAAFTADLYGAVATQHPSIGCCACRSTTSPKATTTRGK